MNARVTVAIVGVLVAIAVHGAAAPGGTVTLDAARVYTAPEATPIAPGRVSMRDGKIVAVGPKPTGKSTEAGDARCSGGVVTAGFQNSHVHFTEDKWNGAGKQPATELSKHLAGMLTRYGFTTVIDTASALENTVALRDRIERHEVLGPRILTAGWALYPPNGIPFYLRDLPPEVLKQLPQPATPEAAAAVVRRNLSGGADVTKLFVLTPQGDGTAQAMPLEIARAAAQETHRRTRLVLAHPTDIPGIRTALTTGVDVLVHTTLGEAKTEWEPALVEQMIARDIAVVPTLKLWGYELEKAKVPERIIGLAVGDTIGQLRAFSEAGGQVLFGTDVGYMTEYDPTEEYVLMQQAGLTAAQILASLTTAPASRWKEESRRGRVAPGLDADLVVLNADPVVDVRNFANVRCVYRQGRLIYPLPK
jgi:imidazolonepropionase-like amidohydrolase